MKFGAKYSIFHFYRHRDLSVLVPAVCASALYAATQPAQTIVLGQIFDALADFTSGNITKDVFMNRVLVLAVVLFSLAFATALFAWLTITFWCMVSDQFISRAHRQVVTALLKKTSSWFDARGDGVLGSMALINRNLEDIRLATSVTMAFSLYAIFACIGSLILAFFYSWALTLVSLAAMPVVVVVILSTTRPINKNLLRSKKHSEEASETMSWTLEAIDTVKLFNVEKSQLGVFETALRNAYKHFIRFSHFIMLQQGLTRILVLSMFVSSFYYGGVLVANGTVTSGAVLIVFWSCLSVADNLQSITPAFPSFNQAQAGIESLVDLILTPLADPLTTTKASIGLYPDEASGDGDGDISFQNVHFAYPTRPNDRVLNGLTMRFEGQRTTFVIGNSGSGKSTIAGLLLRMYDVEALACPSAKERGSVGTTSTSSADTAGLIILSNHSIQHLSLRYLRDTVYVVEQQGHIFDCTLRDNLSMVYPQSEGCVSDTEIRVACEVSGLNDVVAALPQGLDTRLGSHGSTLSGGQRQRVAIARAYLMRDRPVMVFDESLSALDETSRTSLLAAIRRFRRNKTTIIITHELNQIEANDYLYVLAQGRVVEHGLRKVLEFHASSAFNEMARAHKTPISPISPAESTVPSLRGRNGERPRARSMPRDKSMPRVRDHDTVQRQSIASYYGEGSLLRPSSIVGSTSFVLRGSQVNLSASDSTNRGRSTDRYSSTEMSRNVNSKAGFTEFVELETQTPPVPPRARHLIWRVVKSVPDRLLLVVGLMIAVINGVTNPLFAYAFSNLLLFIVPTGGPVASSPLKWAMVVLAMAVLDGATVYLQVVLDVVAERWLVGLKIKAFNSVVHQEFAWFGRNVSLASNTNSFPDPDLASGSSTALGPESGSAPTEAPSTKAASITDLLMNQGENMRAILTKFLNILTTVIALGVCAFVWALISGWQITLVGISLLPGFYLVSIAYRYVVQKWERIHQSHVDGMTDILNEMIAGIRTVKTLGLERYFEQKLDEARVLGKDISLRRAVYSGLGYGASRIFTFISEGLMLWYGMKLVADGTYSLGTVLHAFSLLVFSLVTADQLLSSVTQLRNGFDVFVRITNIIAESSSGEGILSGSPDERIPSPQPRPGIGIGMRRPPSISFRNVSFAYPGRPVILSKMTFDIHAGQVVAITGPSGVGKSTIMLLLTRLYHARAGSIYIDGLDISRMNVHDLRQQIGFVHQMPLSFKPGTILENLEIGSGNSSLEAAREVCQQVGLDSFISGLSQGYHTHMSTSVLSGGQLQRLGLARALVKRPRILILDEVTSALDPESTATVMELIERHKRAQDLTIVLISHQKEVRSVATMAIDLSQFAK